MVPVGWAHGGHPGESKATQRSSRALTARFVLRVVHIRTGLMRIKCIPPVAGTKEEAHRAAAPAVECDRARQLVDPHVHGMEGRGRSALTLSPRIATRNPTTCQHGRRPGTHPLAASTSVAGSRAGIGQGPRSRGSPSWSQHPTARSAARLGPCAQLGLPPCWPERGAGPGVRDRSAAGTSREGGTCAHPAVAQTMGHSWPRPRHVPDGLLSTCPWSVRSRPPGR